ncbi:MAG TPA: histidine kinase [Candidatus Acidoferrales bacterium]|nr:histidine kinase [Candidatus Acidoferrales bacterium]
MKNRWARWAGAILLWSILGVLFALPTLSSGNWRRVLLVSLVQWWSWGLLSPVIFWIDAQLPFKENQLLRRVVAHLPVSVIFTVLHVYVANSMAALFGLQAWSAMARTGFLATLLEGMLWSWLVYWVIFGVRQTFRYYEHYRASELRLEKMERSFSQARLNALRMQLDPHFLFNALNTISSQVERDPSLARAMIEHLGDLLRLSLDARARQEIPLAEEIAFLDHYVAIQKIRFAENLRIEIQVDPEVKYALVPGLVVQPLVENAIRHGISRRASGGTVTVTAERGSNQVEIRVADDGVGLPPGWTLEKSSGMGLSITRERIVGLHPDGDSRFSVRPRAGGGTEVEISLPLRFAGEAAGGATR